MITTLASCIPSFLSGMCSSASNTSYTPIETYCSLTQPSDTDYSFTWPTDTSSSNPGFEMSDLVFGQSSGTTRNSALPRSIFGHSRSSTMTRASDLTAIFNRSTPDFCHYLEDPNRTVGSATVSDVSSGVASSTIVPEASSIAATASTVANAVKSVASSVASATPHPTFTIQPDTCRAGGDIFPTPTLEGICGLSQVASSAADPSMVDTSIADTSIADTATGNFIDTAIDAGSAAFSAVSGATHSMASSAVGAAGSAASGATSALSAAGATASSAADTGSQVISTVGRGAFNTATFIPRLAIGTAYNAVSGVASGLSSCASTAASAAGSVASTASSAFTNGPGAVVSSVTGTPWMETLGTTGTILGTVALGAAVVGGAMYWDHQRQERIQRERAKAQRERAKAQKEGEEAMRRSQAAEAAGNGSQGDRQQETTFPQQPPAPDGTQRYTVLFASERDSVQTGGGHNSSAYGSHNSTYRNSGNGSRNRHSNTVFLRPPGPPSRVTVSAGTSQNSPTDPRHAPARVARAFYVVRPGSSRDEGEYPSNPLDYVLTPSDWVL